MIPPTHRKRRLAARIADPDNVSWPALKQRRLAFKQHGGTNGADVDNFNTQPSARGSTHLSYEHLEAVKSSDDDVLSELSTLSGSEGDVTDVMNEFVQKKGEKWKREGSVVAVTETETPEQELARLMRSWDAPVYGFYEPIPEIEEVGGRRCHVFICAAAGCRHKIRRYLDTHDKASTSALRNHSEICWDSPNGNIAAKNFGHGEEWLSQFQTPPSQSTTSTEDARKLEPGRYIMTDVTTGMTLDLRRDNRTLCAYQFHGKDNQQWEFRPCGEGFVINSVRSSGSFVAVQDLTGPGLCREGGAQVVAEAIPTCWKVEVLPVGPTDEVGDVFARIRLPSSDGVQMTLGFKQSHQEAPLLLSKDMCTFWRLRPVPATNRSEQVIKNAPITVSDTVVEEGGVKKTVLTTVTTTTRTVTQVIVVPGLMSN